MFPEPVLLSDNIIEEIEVLKYETISRCKELNETASLRNKDAVVCSMMANINTSLLYQIKFTTMLNSSDSLLVTTRNLTL